MSHFIQLALEDLKNIVSDAVEIGVQKTLIATGKLKPYLKKREAYNMYGRTTVDRWIKEGLVQEIKDGDHTSAIRLDRVEMELIAKTSNRATYLSTLERSF